MQTCLAHRSGESFLLQFGFVKHYSVQNQSVLAVVIFLEQYQGQTPCPIALHKVMLHFYLFIYYLIALYVSSSHMSILFISQGKKYSGSPFQRYPWRSACVPPLSSEITCHAKRVIACVQHMPPQHDYSSSSFLDGRRRPSSLKKKKKWCRL